MWLHWEHILWVYYYPAPPGAERPGSLPRSHQSSVIFLASTSVSSLHEMKSGYSYHLSVAVLHGLFMRQHIGFEPPWDAVESDESSCCCNSRNFRYQAEIYGNQRKSNYCTGNTPFSFVSCMRIFLLSEISGKIPVMQPHWNQPPVMLCKRIVSILLRKFQPAAGLFSALFWFPVMALLYHIISSLSSVFVKVL